MTNKTKAKIVWVAANITGYDWLKDLRKRQNGRQNYEITDIITLSDTAKTVMYDGVPRQVWNEFGLNVHEVQESQKDLYNVVQGLKPDLLVVAGWRQYIGDEVIQSVNDNVIGFHPALLPYGRGPSPIINSIMTGLRKSGLTMFHYTKELDAGDIVAQQRFKIAKDDQAWDVYNKEIEAGKKLLRRYLPQLAQGTAPRINQDEAKAFYFPKRDPKTFNQIDLRIETTQDIWRKIRALSKHGKKELGRLSYKGAHLQAGDGKLKIWRAHPVEGGSPRTYGTVLETESALLLKTLDGVLSLDLLRFGGEDMTGTEFARRYNLVAGRNLEACIRDNRDI